MDLGAKSATFKILVDFLLGFEAFARDG